MRFIKYSKYTGQEAEAIDLEDLLQALSDFFLQSGFQSQFSDSGEADPQHSMEQLKEAIRQALERGAGLPDEQFDEWLEQMREMSRRQLEQLIDRLAERLQEEGYITVSEPFDRQNSPNRQSTRLGAGMGHTGPRARVKFELTDKSLDFLGYKTLRDLLASLGKSSFGRHDTRDEATGIESSGSSKPYEFGDTLNLDVSGTLFRAIRRQGPKLPIRLDYPDLLVEQCEYQSSCATVLMLDCSHSMILYGEDRFTPAKRVALALSHLIRTQYPGDTLQLVLFHDSAEEVPLAQLARVQVGPYYTNTREGLRLAQRLLTRQRKDMRQIIMITDGKPSALTMEDGRIYKNAFGLDPLVVSETLKEVSKCRRAGILINTFMLASDSGLVNFVQKVTEICRGKAYFTTPFNLGRYLLMDYMSRKTRTVH
jgi:Ca-activated chloride channel family protein